MWEIKETNLWNDFAFLTNFISFYLKINMDKTILHFWADTILNIFYQLILCVGLGQLLISSKAYSFNKSIGRLPN